LLGHHAALLVGHIVTLRLWDDPAELDWFPVLADHLVEHVRPVHSPHLAVEIRVWEGVAVAVRHVSKLALLGHKGDILRFGLLLHFVGWDGVVVALFHHDIVADLLGLGDVFHLVVGLTVLPH